MLLVWCNGECAWSLNELITTIEITRLPTSSPLHIIPLESHSWKAENIIQVVIYSIWISKLIENPSQR